MSNKYGILLHKATENEKVNAVKFLVAEHGADINTKGINGWMSLQRAIAKGEMFVMTFLTPKNRLMENLIFQVGYKNI